MEEAWCQERIKFEMPPHGLPSVTIDPELVLERKLRELWRLDGCFFITDLPNGFSMVRFELEDDFTRALKDGPWTIFGQCLMVQHLSPAFDPNTDSGKFARVCVQLDVNKRLQGAIHVNGKTVLLDYEGLGEICIGCGRQGHLVQHCPTLEKPAVEEIQTVSDPPTNIPENAGTPCLTTLESSPAPAG
ncbi:hypothetical protein V2J09_013096 [Rumex salicifolius]